MLPLRTRELGYQGILRPARSLKLLIHTPQTQELQLNGSVFGVEAVRITGAFSPMLSTDRRGSGLGIRGSAPPLRLFVAYHIGVVSPLSQALTMPNDDDTAQRPKTRCLCCQAVLGSSSASLSQHVAACYLAAARPAPGVACQTPPRTPQPSSATSQLSTATSPPQQEEVLVVKAMGPGSYCLHILATRRCTLGDLHQLLVDTWLTCCDEGHEGRFYPCTEYDYMTSDIPEVSLRAGGPAGEVGRPETAAGRAWLPPDLRSSSLSPAQLLCTLLPLQHLQRRLSRHLLTAAPAWPTSYSRCPSTAPSLSCDPGGDCGLCTCTTP